MSLGDWCGARDVRDARGERDARGAWSGHGGWHDGGDDGSCVPADHHVRSHADARDVAGDDDNDDEGTFHCNHHEVYGGEGKMVALQEKNIC